MFLFHADAYLEQISDKDDEYSNKDIYHIGLPWICYRSELIQDSLQNSVKLDDKTDIIYQIGVGSISFKECSLLFSFIVVLYLNGEVLFFFHFQSDGKYFGNDECQYAKQKAGV